MRRTKINSRPLTKDGNFGVHVQLVLSKGKVVLHNFAKTASFSSMTKEMDTVLDTSKKLDDLSVCYPPKPEFL